MLGSSLLLLSAFAAGIQARDIPANVKAFYDSHRSGACPNPLSAGFSDGQTDDLNVFYCSASGVVYLKGPGTNYADLDIDCDGDNSTSGACSDDQTGSPFTAFQDIVASYGAGVDNLDAHIHTYVVFGNEGASPEWDPRSAGIEPLSLVAVVCNNKLVYGVWGDTNGDVVTGEAALATGQLCFGDDAVSGNRGHGEHDVLYIAFPGTGAVPGASGARWNAATKEEFEASLASLGDRLVAGL